VEGKEGSSRAQNKINWVGGKDVSECDGSSIEMSNTSEDNPSFHEEVSEVCSQTELHGHTVEGKLMELACIVVVVENDVQVGVQTRGPMQSTSLEEYSLADMELSGRHLYNHNDVQKKEVFHVSIPDAATVDNTKDVGNVVGNTRLGNLVETDWERKQRISALI
jgi:hypothetical protein